MRIKSFSMTGYRGVRETQTISLSPHMNILFGENGAGKSTVLYGMMTALSWFAARVRSTYGNGELIGDRDINNRCDHAELSITCSTGDGRAFTWSIHTGRSGFEPLEKSDYSELNVITRSVQRKREAHGVEVSLPIIALYPTDRRGLDIPVRMQERCTFDPIALYERDEIRNSTFTAFSKWCRDQQAIEYEDRIEDEAAGSSLNTVGRSSKLSWRTFPIFTSNSGHRKDCTLRKRISGS